MIKIWSCLGLRTYSSDLLNWEETCWSLLCPVISLCNDLSRPSASTWLPVPYVLFSYRPFTGGMGDDLYYQLFKSVQLQLYCYFLNPLLLLDLKFCSMNLHEVITFSSALLVLGHLERESLLRHVLKKCCTVREWVTIAEAFFHIHLLDLSFFPCGEDTGLSIRLSVQLFFCPCSCFQSSEGKPSILLTFTHWSDLTCGAVNGAAPVPEYGFPESICTVLVRRLSLFLVAVITNHHKLWFITLQFYRSEVLNLKMLAGMPASWRLWGESFTTCFFELLWAVWVSWLRGSSIIKASNGGLIEFFSVSSLQLSLLPLFLLLRTLVIWAWWYMPIISVSFL